MDGKLGDFYFERSNGERVLLGTGLNRDGAFKVMDKFLNDHNYKSPYIRVWEEGNVMWFDVGSHCEFFLLIHKNTEE